MAKLRIPALGDTIQAGEVRMGKVSFGVGGDVDGVSVTGLFELIDIDAGAHGGVRILDMQLQVLTAFLLSGHTASGSACTLTIGDGSSAAGFFASADIAPETVDTVPINLEVAAEAYEYGQVYEADDTIDVTLGGNGATGSGLLELAVVYTVGLD